MHPPDIIITKKEYHQYPVSYNVPIPVRIVVILLFSKPKATFYSGFLQVDDILIFIPVIRGEQTYT